MAVSRALSRRVLASIQESLRTESGHALLSKGLFKLPTHSHTKQQQIPEKTKAAEAAHDALQKFFERNRVQQDSHTAASATESIDTVRNPIAFFSRTKKDPLELVRPKLVDLNEEITRVVGTDHPLLNQIAQHLFKVPGKRMRPAVVLLLSMATATEGAEEILESQFQLSQITELIHVASLFHDDVIDSAKTRRGRPSINAAFGDKAAVLGGDFLLARASVLLARLRHCDVIELMSQIIDDLVKGEIMQMRPVSSTSDSVSERLNYYMAKSYYKTASLLANSCHSAALLANHSEHLQSAAREYGKHLGLAFQIMDDLLDFEGTSQALGKAVNADLGAGIATAPVIYAAEQFPELHELMARNFKEIGDVPRAVRLVARSDGLARTRSLARKHGEMAVAAACQLDQFRPASQSLVSLIESVLK